MAYNNGDQAVVIPNNNVTDHFAQQLYAQGIQNKRLAQQQAEDDRQRQDMLSKYIGQEFQNKDYMSGTAFDPVINQRIADSKQKYLSMLSSNPKMSNADLSFLMQKDIGDLTAMSSGLKNGNANIQAQAKAFSKLPGIDSNALEQMAKTKMLYDIDPTTGAKTLKDPNKIDYSKDYVSEVLMDHPELVSKGDQGLRAYMKTFQPQDLGKTIKREVKGVTVETKFDAKVPPYMELTTDKNGIGTGVKVRGELVPGYKNPDGSPLEVVDKDVYENFNTDPSSSIVIQKMFKDWNSKQKESIPNDSEQADLVKRKLLYDYLGKNGVYEFKPGYSATNNSIKDKQDFGIPLWKATMSEIDKLKAANAKFEGLDPSIILRGLKGDKDILDGATPRIIGGKKYYDLTNMIGGMTIGYDSDNNKPIKATGVMVDPLTGSYRVERDGKAPVILKGIDIVNDLVNKAGMNGSNADKTRTAARLQMDDKGNFIDRNPDFIKNAAKDQAKIDAARYEAVQSHAEKFATSGNLGDLKPVIGARTLDGGHILDVKKKPLLSTGKPYYLVIQNGDKTSKPQFDTQAEVAQYIKDNTTP